MPIKTYQTPPNSPLALSEIQTEFGGANPIALSEYWAGAGLVPPGTVGFPSGGASQSIPSSAAISVNNFYGSAATVPVTVTVTPTSGAEGTSYSVQLTDSATPVRAQLWWRLGSYNNLDSGDFSPSEGVVTSSGGVFPSFTFNSLVDSTYEGSGTFRVEVFSDSSRTLSVGQSNLITVTDTWSGVTTDWTSSGVSATRIYRYADINSARTRASMRFAATGLRGATIYWEILIDGVLGSGNTDLNQPGGAFSGVTVMPSTDQFEIQVQAALWTGSNTVAADRNITVRFRLESSVGQLLATSSILTLSRSPEVVVFGFSPTTINRGDSTVLTGTIRYMDDYSQPEGHAGVYETSNNDVNTDLVGFAAAAGPIPWTQETISGTYWAAPGASSKTVSVTWRIYSTGGQGIWNHSITLLPSPTLTAGNVQASRTNMQVYNISAYPYAARTWTARARISGAASWFATKTLTAAAGQTFTNSDSVGFPDVGTNPGSHSVQYEFISSDGYPTYTVTTSETFTWPVDSIALTMTGVNAQGQARTLSAVISSSVAYGPARVYPIQIRYKLSTQLDSEFSDWLPLPFSGPQSTVTIPAGGTVSPSTVIWSTPSTTLATSQDFEIRCNLAGHEQRVSLRQNGIFLV